MEEKNEIQVISVNGVDYKINGGSVEPDWNANEGEEGYIKNKPFGDVKTYIYENTDVTINNQANNGYGPLNVSFLNGFTWNTGVTYTVVINDKIYSNLSTYSNGFLANDYTGSPSPLYSNADFTLTTSQNSTGGAIYFKEPFNNGSVIIFANLVNKLDEKFGNDILFVPDNYLI